MHLKTMSKDPPPNGPAALVEVGGAIDESAVTLAIYGEHLNPNEVTQLLGVEPTKSFRSGHKPGPRSPAIGHGAWFFEVRGKAPAGPDAQLELLLSKLPESASIWQELNRHYKVQIRFGLHMQGWNKGFCMEASLLSRLASMGVALVFDLYAYDDKDA